jgi:hypothetical protein
MCDDAITRLPHLAMNEFSSCCWEARISGKAKATELRNG